MKFNPGASFHAHVAQVRRAAEGAGGGVGALQAALEEWHGHACNAHFSEEFRYLVAQAVYAE